MLRGWEPGAPGRGRVCLRLGRNSYPMGKGAVASRVGMGGRLGNVCPLTCSYAATSVLGHCKTWGRGGCAVSPMILRVTLAFCLHRMLGSDRCLPHRQAEFGRLMSPTFQTRILSLSGLEAEDLDGQKWDHGTGLHKTWVYMDLSVGLYLLLRCYGQKLDLHPC